MNADDQERLQKLADEHAAEFAAQLERAEQLVAANPGMAHITAVIMAGDQLSAERWTARFAEHPDEYPLDKRPGMIGSYARWNWALDNMPVDWRMAHIAELWRGSDPDDTDPRALAEWRMAVVKNGVRYIRDGRPLPRGNIIPVFRGQMPGDPIGIAWTTDLDIADKFARGAGVRRPTAGVILSGWVRRDRVIAYVTGRGEAEVIVDPADVFAIETIREYKLVPSDDRSGYDAARKDGA